MQVKQGSPWNPTSAPTFWINHASRAVMRRFEERLRPLGFGMAYLPVVITLEEEGPLYQRDLLERVHIEQPTMAALLTRMERDGLIVRKPDPVDGRARQVSLTPRAKSQLARAKEVMQDVVDEALAGVSEKERASLVRTLRTVVKNLGEVETP